MQTSELVAIGGEPHILSLVKAILESHGLSVTTVYCAGLAGQETEGPGMPAIQEPFQLDVLVESIRKLVARQRAVVTETQSHLAKSIQIVQGLQAVADLSQSGPRALTAAAGSE